MSLRSISRCAGEAAECGVEPHFPANSFYMLRGEGSGVVVVVGRINNTVTGCGVATCAGLLAS